MRNNQPVNNHEYVLSETQSPISRTDIHSNITFVNADFIEASGFTEEELLGQTHNLVRHPDMPPEAFADMWSYLKVGRSWTGMVKNRRKDGGYYWVLANASPMRENGTVVGYASVRMKPSPEQIAQADKAYAKIRQLGSSSGLRIKRGRIVRTGLGGKLDKLFTLGITGRLNVMVGSMIMLMLLVGFIGAWGVRSANQQIETMYRESGVAISYLDTIARQQYRVQIDIATALIEHTPEKTQTALSNIEKNRRNITKTWESYLAIGHDTSEQAGLREFEVLRTKYGKEGIDPALTALRAGDFAQAQSLYNNIILPQFENLSRNIDSQISDQDKSAKLAMQEAGNNYQMVRVVILLVILVGIILAIIMRWRFKKSTVQRINEAVALAKQIAVGALNNKIEVHGHDETAQLMAALFAMQRSLSSLAQGVLEGARYIGEESREIARGNESLAARTEEQATALQEAASNMEEVSTTVKMNVDNARAANTLAQEAGGIANQAGAAMGQVVGTMDSIARSSKMITDIISVIDGIAFQTNILALNAAVEAARAGEQGRGFAVVASEVRSLAKRSADAAKEIKTLIEDSVRQVEGGLIQVSEARETIEATIKSVGSMASIMGEILHSSDEQGVAINRVAQLVVQIDEATQQNVPIAEQAAASSRGLEEQGQALARNAGVFRLD